MRHTLSLLLVLASLVALLTGCENCGPSTEPSLQVNVSWTTAGKVDTLYALGSQRPLPTQPYSTTGLTNYSQFVAPLNLNADSSQYVFGQNGRKDTLTVFYKRNYSYRDTNCGYVIDLTAPLGKQVYATRGKVESVNYEQNSYQGGIGRTIYQTGIYLSLRL